MLTMKKKDEMVGRTALFQEKAGVEWLLMSMYTYMYIHTYIHACIHTYRRSGYLCRDYIYAYYVRCANYTKLKYIINFS